MGGMQSELDGDSAVDSELDDAAFARAMLDVEAGLARALARAGLAPQEAGDEVTAALDTLEVDASELGRRARIAGNPVVPLVEDVLAVVPREAQVAVHFGATSQDILDTALMLCAARAREPLLENLRRACDAAAALCRQFRDEVMVARTLGQWAAPTTFGLKVAGWLEGLLVAEERLRNCRLDIQLGGAVGTLAAYGAGGPRVMELLADEVSLGDPGAPWHTERSRIRALAAAASEVIYAAGKIATDVILLSQNEVLEVAEGAPGGSSAMPHKRNPVASVLLVSAARRTPGLLATVTASSLHEHERATGSWHAEWAPIREVLHLAGGAAARLVDLLTGLHVDTAAMRKNLDAAQPGAMAEAYATERIATLGRAGAQDAARRAVAEAGDEPIGDPTAYLGAAGMLVDRALAAHDQQRSES